MERSLTVSRLLFLGAGVITLEFNSPPKESPLDDGVLLDGDNIIILHGSPRIVNGILHSKYRLEYKQDPQYNAIGICSIILLAQFLLQLFLIPQGELIGQIFFIATLAVSWICNGYFASSNYDEIKTNTLFNLIGEPVVHYTLMFDKRQQRLHIRMFYFRGLQNQKRPSMASYPITCRFGTCGREYICSSIAFNRQPSISSKTSAPGLTYFSLLITKRQPLWRAWKGWERSLGLPDKKFLAHLMREADRERPRAIAAARSVSAEMDRFAHPYTHTYGPWK